MLGVRAPSGKPPNDKPFLPLAEIRSSSACLRLDGKRFAIEVAVVFGRGAHNSCPRVAVANVNGTGFHDLTDSTVVGINPDWSRDGKSIAFTVADSASHGQIAVVDADGSNYRVIAVECAEYIEYDWRPPAENELQVSEVTGHRRVAT